MSLSTTKRIIFLILIHFLFVKIATAQVTQNLRIEYPIDDWRGHHVVMIEEQKRALVVSMVNDKGKDVLAWNFELIDENLKKVKSINAEFDRKFESYQYNFYDNHYYMILYDKK